MDTWRLLLTPAAPGAWNMAVDEALLESIGRGDSLPALRLYAWDPPCLSLGYAQPVSDVDLPRLSKHGWDLVRRPTGGRAILHTDELTYAVIASRREPRLAGTLLESYEHLASALLAALRSLGLPVEMQPPAATPSATNPNPVCFEVPSSGEITVGGKKLVGSAQARRKEGILQHGSLPLRGELGRVTQVLAFPNEAARSEAAARLLARAATVESILGREVAWEEAAQAFIAAFGKTLALELQPSQLTPIEERRATELASSKYAQARWIEQADV
jgi:lipoate-protein ligase A